MDAKSGSVLPTTPRRKGIVIRKDDAWRFGRFPSDVGFTRLVRVPKRKVKANSKPANLSHKLILF